MGYGDIRDDWKLNEIERTANEAHRRLYEIDTLHSKVDSLERERRELSSEISGFRSEIQTLQNEQSEIKRLLEKMESV